VHQRRRHPIGEHTARPALSGHLGLHPTFSSKPVRTLDQEINKARPIAT
jgi:hypothetical protein